MDERQGRRSPSNNEHGLLNKDVNGRHGRWTLRATKQYLFLAVAGALINAGAFAAGAQAENSTLTSQQAAKLSPQLTERLASQAGREVPVIITLNAEADTEDATSAGQVIRELRATAAASQRTVMADIDGPARRYWLVNAISTKVTATEAADLAANPAVESIDIDAPVSITQDMTAGIAGGVNGWGLDAIGAPAAWSTYGVTGRGVRLGSIDTGVDASHPQIAGSVVAWRDFVAGAPTPYDDNGHGTHTVGTMAGRNANGVQVGVAPEAEVVVAKAMGAQGTATSSTLLAAAQWMTDPDGNPATADHPTVINNSWTTGHVNNEWFRPMVQAWVAMGITPVFAAGNTGGEVGSPSSYPEVIAVGATDQAGAVWSGSNRGTSSWTTGDQTVTVGKPDVVAPGVAVTSAVPGGYSAYTGTSMATPHTAGTIALLKQVRPDLGTEQIRSILRQTATDIDAPGIDLPSGAGRINTLAAVAATGAPAVAQQQAPVAEAAPQADAAPQTDTQQAEAQQAAEPTIDALQVTRQATRFVVTGRVNQRATVSFRARSTNGVRYTTSRRITSSGRFRMVVPARARGTYSLNIVVKAAGRPAETISTVVRASKSPMMKRLNVVERGNRLVVSGQVARRAVVTSRTTATTSGKAVTRRSNARTSFRMTVPQPKPGFRLTMQFAR